jgi:hypothetical protein
MNLRKLFLTENACYKFGKKMAPRGILVHSTGANNPNLKRYIGPDDGLLGVNQGRNHWNTAKPDGRSVCVHGFIGLLGDGVTVATYQTLPWDMAGWHSGSGSKGSAANCNNNGYIGFEICEDGLTDPVYFGKVYQEAVELCAMLCKAYGIAPDKPFLICHSEGHALGIASNHGDVMHWFPKHGKNMDIFRADVKRAITGPAPTPPAAPAALRVPAAETDAVIWPFFSGKGLNACAVAGLMGNLFAESGLIPANLQNNFQSRLGMDDAAYTAAVDSGAYGNFANDGAGYGLAQWTYHTRKQALLDHVRAAGASVGDLTAQLDFLWAELQKYTGLMAVLRAAKTIREVSDAVLLQYERPADQGEAVKVKRAEYAQGFYDKFAPAAADAAPAFKVGAVVQFSGGAVYASANAAIPAHSRGKSRCKVTQVYNGKHPYHLVSEDDQGVYGWVEAMDVTPIGASGGKSVDEIAREVIAGKWGSGQDRKNRLAAAGYDYGTVQNRVNELLK